LDGLDEAPTLEDRKLLSSLVEKSVATFPRSRFVVTSRPAAYHGEVVLPGFRHVHIDALDDEVIETFLRHWCQALFVGSPSEVSRLLKAVIYVLSMGENGKSTGNREINPIEGAEFFAA